ncbi:hypothetical protein TNCV_2057301 [Trichonephila clavipes]|nr:hypothetical protein TNCV_2057301 [Trichonephila clavipes]
MRSTKDQLVKKDVLMPVKHNVFLASGKHYGENGIPTFDFVHILMLTPDLLLEFLREPDLVKTILMCGKCSNVMKLRPKTSMDRYVWTCRSSIDKKECGSQRSIRYGSLGFRQAN